MWDPIEVDYGDMDAEDGPVHQPPNNAASSGSGDAAAPAGKARTKQTRTESVDDSKGAIVAEPPSCQKEQIGVRRKRNARTTRDRQIADGL